MEFDLPKKTEPVRIMPFSKETVVKPAAPIPMVQSGTQDVKPVRFDMSQTCITDPEVEPEPNVEPKVPKPVPRKKYDVQRNTAHIALNKDSEEEHTSKQLDGNQDKNIEVDKRCISSIQDTKLVRFDITDPEDELEERLEPEVPKPVPRKKYNVQRNTLAHIALNKDSEEEHTSKQLDGNQDKNIEVDKKCISSIQDTKLVRFDITDPEDELEERLEPEVPKPVPRKKYDVQRNTLAHIALNKDSEEEHTSKQLEGNQDKNIEVDKKCISSIQDTKLVRFDITDPEDELEERLEPEVPKPVPRKKYDVQRDTLPIQSLKKDSEEAHEVKQLDRNQEKNIEVDKRRMSGSQGTKVVRFDIADSEDELEPRVEPNVPKTVPRRKYDVQRDALAHIALNKDSEEVHEVKQIDGNQDESIKVDMRHMSSALSLENQSETSTHEAQVVSPLQPAKINQNRQRPLMYPKETETEKQKEKLSPTHWEKTSGDDQMSTPTLQEQSVIEKREKQPMEPSQKYVWNEPVIPEKVTSTSKEDDVHKPEEVPLGPPVRTKGKLTAPSKASESSFKESGERKPSKDDPEEDQGGEDSVPPHGTSVIEATEKKSLKPIEKMSSIDVLKAQAVKQTERPVVIEAVPPKPPARTKGKAKGTLGNQFLRDSEASQDEEQVLVSPVFKKEVQVAHDLVKPFKKKCEENADGERKRPVTQDLETEHDAKQLVKSKERDVEMKQPLLPVKPASREPKLEEGRKHAVRPMRLENEPSEPCDNVPLLYITEDDAFSETASEKTVDSSNIQSLAFTVIASSQPEPIQLLPKVPQLPQTPMEAAEDIDVSIENEPEMLEAAVKIQAAFKGYKARKDMRPVFKEVFKNQSVELGGTIHLECVAEGKLDAVRWLKHGQQIITDQRHRMKTLENGVCVLEVTDVNIRDSGVYTCEVVNKFGVISYSGNITAQQTQHPTPATTTKPVHPPLAAITPLQPVPQKPQAPAKPMSQALPPTQTPVAPVASANELPSYVVESECVSLWEAYNLTEQDAQMSLQERRRASLIPASSSK
ncbi:Obscurin [Merluccius polli]|uniref:Obscurin n=1 Tax=Merluccius polli TaxID=89951 RepID=A0AA47PB11_MERPO|nr:Obscurin [Merluccius polli]